MTVARPARAGEQRRLVDQVGEVGAREAGRAARDRSQVDVGVDRDLARVDAEDCSRPFRSGLPTVTCRSNRPGRSSAGSRMSCRLVAAIDDDALVRLEAVHLDEQLVERLLALFVAERVAAAAAADGVELVDEDDAGADGGARRGTAGGRATRRRRRTSRRNRSRWRRGTARRLRPQSIAPAASCRCPAGRRAARPSGCGRRSRRSGPARGGSRRSP